MFRLAQGEQGDVASSVGPNSAVGKRKGQLWATEALLQVRKRRGECWLTREQVVLFGLVPPCLHVYSLYSKQVINIV